MAEFRFRTQGASPQAIRWSLKQATPKTTLVVVSTVAATVLYAVNQPGQIHFTSPASETWTDGTSILVSGRVTNAATDRISLELNGRGHDVIVKDLEFAVRLPLRDGRNTIRPLSVNAGVHLVNRSDILVVHSVEHPGPIRVNPDLPDGARVIGDSGLMGENSVWVVDADRISVSGTVGLFEKVEDQQLKHIGLHNSPGDEFSLVPVRNGQFRSWTVSLQPGINYLEAQASDPDARLRHEAPPIAVYCLAEDDISITHPADKEVLFTGTTLVTANVPSDLDPFQQLVVMNEGSLPPNADIPESPSQAVFRGKTYPLKGGVSQLRVRVGGVQSKPVEVIAPVLVHNFEQGDSGWRLSGRTKEPVPLLSRASHPSRCLLSRGGPMQLDLVFCVDVSNSMAECLADVAAHTRKIFSWLRPLPNTRVGVVSFSAGTALRADLTESPQPAEHYLRTIVKTEDFSANVTPGEDLYLGLFRALSHMNWRESNAPDDVARVIILMTDEPASKDSFANPQSNSPGESSDGRSHRLLKKELLPETKEWFWPERGVLSAEAIARRSVGQSVSIHAIVYDHEDVLETEVLAALQSAESVAKPTGGTVRISRKSAESEKNPGPAAELIDLIEFAAESSNPRMWVAPRDVLDVLRTGSGCTISFELSNTPACVDMNGTAKTFEHDDIILFGQDHTLVRRLPRTDDLSTRKRFLIRLTNDGSWRHRGTDRPAADDEFADTLKGIRKLWIRADYIVGADESSLDNFAVFRPPLPDGLKKNDVCSLLAE